MALLAVIVVQGLAQPPAASQPGAATAVGDGLDPLTDVRPAGDVIAVAGVDTSDTDRRIDFWQGRVRGNARDDIAWTYLGDLFELKGRQTGDVADYISARQAYATALQIAPDSPAAHIGAARIAATLHDFAGALALATNVLEVDPSATGALAIVFDASLELGDLATAQHALALLAQRVESPAVLGREARLAFVRGDTAQALNLSAQAADDAASGGDPPSSIAFYAFTHAEYELLGGDLDAALTGYRDALSALPGYPLAIYGQGRVAYARGDVERATGLLETAVAALPRPDMVAYLGDLYALAGRTADAKAQYDTVEFIHGLAAADGARVYDREYVAFLADHGRDAATAIDLARSELEVRKDAYGYDALAWALHGAGSNDEAIQMSAQALSVGTRDARLLVHAGLIELAAGRTAQGRDHLAQGLALDPSFSPLVVRAAHEALGQ